MRPIHTQDPTRLYTVHISRRRSTVNLDRLVIRLFRFINDFGSSKSLKLITLVFGSIDFFPFIFTSLVDYGYAAVSKVV